MKSSGFLFLLFFCSSILMAQTVNQTTKLKSIRSPFQADDNQGRCTHLIRDVALDNQGNKMFIWVDDRMGQWNAWLQRISPDGEIQYDPLKLNQHPARTSSGTNVETMRNNRFAVTWGERGSGGQDIFYQLYDSAGIALTDAIQVNDNSTFMTFSAFTMNDEGKSILFWNGTIENRYALFYRLIDKDGHLLGEPQQLFSQQGDDSQIVFFDAGMDGRGNSIVNWSETANGFQWYNYFQRLDLEGQPQGSPESGGGHYPICQVASDGTFVLGNGKYFQYYDALGEPMGDTHQIDVTGLWDGINFGLTASLDLVYTWSSGESFLKNVFCQKYSKNGEHLTQPVVLNDNQKTSECRYAVMASNTFGQWLFCWYDYRDANSDIYYQLCDSLLNPIGQNKRLNQDNGSAAQTRPAIAVNNNRLAVLWQDDRRGRWDIVGQLYNHHGDLEDDFFILNEKNIRGIDHSSQVSPGLAWIDQSSFYSIWKNNDYNDKNIMIHRFNTQNGNVDSNMTINDPSVPFEDITAKNLSIGSNQCLVVFEVKSTDGYSNRNIYFQRYDLSGRAIGENIRVVDENVPANQMNPCVAVKPDDRFIIAWCDERDGRKDIYFQQFDTDGSPSGSQLSITNNRLSENAIHNYPEIAVMDDGSFFVVWSEKESDEWHIACQLFDREGLPKTSVARLNDLPFQARMPFCITTDSDGLLVVVWQVKSESMQRLGGQIITPEGYLAGWNFSLNTTIQLSNFYHDIAIFDRQLFTVWDDNYKPQQRTDILMQIDRVNAPPVSPQIIKPTNEYNSSDPQVTPSFLCPKDMEDDPIQFVIYIARDSLFTQPLAASPFDSEVNSTGFEPAPPYRYTTNDTIQFTLPELLADGTYWIQVIAKDAQNQSRPSKVCQITLMGTSVKHRPNVLPKEFKVYQPYPNPFNAETTICYDLPKDTHIECTLYDITGRKKEVLYEGHQQAGNHRLKWQANAYASGLYFIQIRAAAFVSTIKCVLIK